MDKTYLTEDLPEAKTKAPHPVTGVEKVVMTVERVGYITTEGKSV